MNLIQHRQELEAAATPPPWSRVCPCDDGELELCGDLPADYSPLRTLATDTDLALISAARNDYPVLLEIAEAAANLVYFAEHPDAVPADVLSWVPRLAAALNRLEPLEK